jgi:hypothetical protein
MISVRLVVVQIPDCLQYSISEITTAAGMLKNVNGNFAKTQKLMQYGIVRAKFFNRKFV